MKTKLQFTNTSQGASGLIYDTNIFGGVNYTQEANNETDLSFGATACSTVKFTTDLLDSSSVGEEFDYYVKQTNDGSNWRLIGHYTVVEATRNKTKFDIVAYDNIVKFDKVIDTWLAGVTFPIRLDNLFKSLVRYCLNVQDDSKCVITEIPANASVSIPNNFTTTNITGRTILGYLAQMAAGFAYAMPDGRISIRGYSVASGRTTSLDNTKYNYYEYADYTAPQITKVLVASDNDEATVPVVAGSGTSVLRIIANPFLIAETAAEIQPAVTNIYNAVKDYSYVPMRVDLLQDFGINVGDIITVNNVSTLVMTKVFDESGVTLKSTGNKERETQTYNVLADINALRGSNTKIKIDLNGITTEVSNARGQSSTLRQELQRIEASVSSSVQTTKSATPPAIKNTGDLWCATQDISIGGVTYYANHIYRWNGSAWESFDVTNTQLNTNIAQYVDSAAGRAVIESVASGTYLKKTDAADTYETIDNVAQISQEVDAQGAKIGLVVTSTGSGNQVNAASIVTAVNNSGSSVKIDADKIQMTGTTTFLTKSAADTYYDANGAATGVKNGLATAGYTTINGGNITTGTINASTVNVTNINADNINVSGHSIGSSSSKLNNMYTFNTYSGQEHVTNNLYVGTGDNGQIYIRSYEGGSYTATTRLNPVGVQYNGTTYRWDAIGSGGGEPAAYIKSASVSGNTLTLTKKDNTTVVFTPVARFGS